MYLQTQLGDEQYVFTRLNYLLDRMASSDTLTHTVVEPSTLVPSSGVIQQSSAVHTTGAGSISIVGAGVFASASLVSFRNRKEVDLNEVCTTMLAKIPKVWSKVSCILLKFQFFSPVFFCCCSHQTLFFFHIKSSKPLSYQNQHYLV